MGGTTRHWSRSRVLASATTALATAALVVVAVPAAPVLAASVCDDATGPVLHSLTKSKTSVDVTKKSAKVTFTAHVTDDISGVASVSVFLSSPTKKGTTRSAGATLAKASGTVTDGVWKGTATIQRWTIDGTWHVIEVFAEDKVGNTSFYGETELTDLGAATTLKVTANPDLVQPTLNGLSYSPKSVNTKTGVKTVKITATLKDKGGSGVAAAYVTFSRTAGGGNHGTSAFLTHKKGTANTYVGTARVPKYADVKSTVTWETSATVYDNASNYRSYTTKALKAKKWPTKLHVTTTPDTKAPVRHKLTVNPDSVDVTSKAKKVTVTAKMTDNLSGVNWVTVTFSSTSFYTLNASLTLASGKARSGTWKGTITVPLCRASGTYTLDQLQTIDRTGNSRGYADADLPDLTITVVGKT